MASNGSYSLEPRRSGIKSSIVVLLLIGTGYALSSLLGFTVGKVVFGFITIGYVPGALLIRLLFHASKKLTVFENLVLSLVFSLVLCAGLGLLLNVLPGGLSPFNINLALWGLVALLLILNLGLHRWRAGQVAPTKPHSESLLRQIRTQLSKTEFVAYSVIVVIALICLALLFSLLLQANNGERFTEFYVLGTEGIAESYTHEVVVGEDVSITAGLTNREGEPADYWVEVRIDGLPIRTEGPVMLVDGETREVPIHFVFTQPGADQKTEFLLYKEGETEPYRSLQRWINVLEPEGS